MQNQVDVNVGRLVEVRAAAGYRSVADVEAVFHRIAEVTGRVLAPRIVMIVDWRRCPIMSSDAAEYLLSSLKRNNARLERCAALALADSPLKMLQFLRLVRSADNPNRKLFEQPMEAITWLSEVLNPEERKRLRDFVAGTDS